MDKEVLAPYADLIPGLKITLVKYFAKLEPIRKEGIRRFLSEMGYVISRGMIAPNSELDIWPGFFDPELMFFSSFVDELAGILNAMGIEATPKEHGECISISLSSLRKFSEFERHRTLV